MPSHPALPGIRERTGKERPKERSIASRLSQRLSPRRRNVSEWESYPVPDDPRRLAGTTWEEWDDADDSGSRTRERNAARPLHPRTTAHTAIATPAERGLVSAHSNARSAPTAARLTAYQTPGVLGRTPAYTRAVLKKARSPWAMTRTALALCAMALALIISLTSAGDPGFTPPTFNSSAGTHNAIEVAAQVKPIIQLLQCNEYDSYAQCQSYGNAACSAAAMTEIFNAWGVPEMSIGRVIDELGNDISPNGGLLTHDGFERVAAKHGFRADEHTGLTYNQMLYITNTLGIPLIVDVRISYGYYRFLAGGHFLVMTGGDKNGVNIVDSSTYYIHYLPKDIFYSMFTDRTTLLVPQGFQYTLPPN